MAPKNSVTMGLPCNYFSEGIYLRTRNQRTNGPVNAHLICGPRISTKQLEFMFMKHYAPNRCEPSIEVIMKMGFGGGVGFLWGVRVDVNKNIGLKLL